MTRIIQEDRPETLERIRELESALSVSQEQAEAEVKRLREGSESGLNYSIALQHIIEALDRGTPWNPDSRELAGWHLAMAERVRARERRMREALTKARELSAQYDACKACDIEHLCARCQDVVLDLLCLFESPAPVTETAPATELSALLAPATQGTTGDVAPLPLPPAVKVAEFVIPVTETAPRAPEPQKAWTCPKCGAFHYGSCVLPAAPAETSTRAEEGQTEFGPPREKGNPPPVCMGCPTSIRRKVHPYEAEWIPCADCGGHLCETCCEKRKARRATPTETTEPKAGSRVVAHFVRPEKKEGES